MGDGIFEDAEVPTCIFILKKTKVNEKYYYLLGDFREYKNSNIEINFCDYLQGTNIQNILLNENKIFGLDNLSNNIIDKLFKHNSTFENYIKLANYGVTTSKNPIFIITKDKANELNIEKEIIKEIYEGSNITRYNVSYDNKCVILIKANENIDKYPNAKKYLLDYKEDLEKRNTDAPYFALHRERIPELFYPNKIIMRQTGDKIIAMFDTSAFYCLDSILCIVLKDNINPLFILALLNSKLFEYTYNSIAQEKGRNFAQVKPNNIKKMPIINTTNEGQQSLAQKAEQMIELNKQLHNGIDSAIELMKTEYQPEKISKNLEKFYTLGVHPFIEELEKQKVKLSLSQKEELIAWYKEKSEKLNQIQSEINNLDKIINQEVYKLYDLTDSEIKIIEGN